ncbi:MAG TPA: ABC transporter substrate-binding protein [Acetobacteraceae bacterium]|nr:ABC transporter substrate-binding protein [Acetobacteraceae bacterium]
MTRISRRHVLAGAVALPFAPRFAHAARQPDTLTFALSSYPPNLQPWANTGTAALTVKTQLFRGLLSFGPDGKVRGELAESWERDGEQGWVFRLREAKFQNGAPVTAEDVKWTVEQIGSEKGGAYLRGQFRDVASVETPDPRTVRILTKTPIVTLPLMLATPFAAIIAKDTLAAPVGAGPYAIASQERGVAIELQAFPSYYKPGMPKLKRIRFVAYADENARVAALQAGDVDMIEYVPWQSMATIEADPKLKLDTVDGPYMGLAFNGGSGPFKDKRLRQAVAVAIRRDEIIKAAFFGRGTVLESLPIPKISEFYNETYAHGWKYDPDRAKKLMAEAGVGGGFACTLLSTAQYGMHKSTAEIVQQHLGEIGIEVKLNLPDWPTRVSLGNRGQYEFCVQGQTPDNNDPDGLSAYIDGELPPDNARSAHLPTPRIHELLAQGRAEFDDAKRHAIYDELQKVALDVVPLAGLCWRSQGYAMRRDAQGFSNLPGGLNFYSGYSLENLSFAA